MDKFDDSYTIRHRSLRNTAWYNRDLYNYSSYNTRRWSARSDLMIALCRLFNRQICIYSIV